MVIVSVFHEPEVVDAKVNFSHRQFIRITLNTLVE